MLWPTSDLSSEGKLQTATLPTFIRPPLAPERNDILMYNLQALPEAEVAYMMEQIKWLLWHKASGDLLFNLAVCFQRND